MNKFTTKLYFIRWSSCHSTLNIPITLVEYISYLWLITSTSYRDIVRLFLIFHALLCVLSQWVFPLFFLFIYLFVCLFVCLFFFLLLCIYNSYVGELLSRVFVSKVWIIMLPFVDPHVSTTESWFQVRQLYR